MSTKTCLFRRVAKPTLRQRECGWRDLLQRGSRTSIHPETDASGREMNEETDILLQILRLFFCSVSGPIKSLHSAKTIALSIWENYSTITHPVKSSSFVYRILRWREGDRLQKDLSQLTGSDLIFKRCFCCLFFSMSSHWSILAGSFF